MPSFLRFKSRTPKDTLHPLLACQCSFNQSVDCVLTGNDLPVEILVRSGKEDRVRHVPIISWSLRWQLTILLLRQLALLIILALPRRHFTWEHSRSNGVDTDLDALVRDLGRQHLGQVVGSRLAGIIGEMALGLEHDSGNGGDVDTSAGVPLDVIRGAGEERKEGAGHEVDLGDVGLVLGCPVVEGLALGVEEVVAELLGVLACGRDLAGGLDAGVVDQDAEVLFAGLDLLGETQDIFLVGDIANERDDLAGDAFAVGFDDGLQLIFGTADDIDLGPVDSEGLCDHQADAAPYRAMSIDSGR